MSVKFNNIESGFVNASHGVLPTRTSADVASGPGDLALQRLLILAPQAGTYYLLVSGLESIAGTRPFTITARTLDFEVDSASPAVGGNTGRVTSTLVGAGFTKNSQAGLTDNAGTVVSRASVTYESANVITATFDLTGVAPGRYALNVTDGTLTSTLPDGYLVVNGVPGMAKVTVTSPAVIMVGGQGVVTVDYVNDGQTDAEAPLILLVPDNASFHNDGERVTTPLRVLSTSRPPLGLISGLSSSITAMGSPPIVIVSVKRLPGPTATPAPADPSFNRHTELFLGINDHGPAGVLTPGAAGHREFRFRPDTIGAHVFSYFSAYVIDPKTPIDWNALKDKFKPPLTPAPVWDAIFANFVADAGTTAGQLQSLLDREATYLSGLGEYVSDVNQLIFLAIAQAGDGGRLVVRNTLGALGYNIPDPTDFKAITLPDRRVVVRSQGTLRAFTPGSDGAFVGDRGDTGVLSRKGPGLELKEKDGSIADFGLDGALILTADANGNTRTPTRDSTGRIDGWLDSAGASSVHYDLDAQGRIVRTTDAFGVVTTATYDASDTHLLSLSDPGGTIRFTYVTRLGPARENALASVDYPDGSQTVYQYDDRGRIASQVVSGRVHVTYTYPAPGEVTITDATGAHTSSFFDDKGHLARFDDPAGGTTLYAYDASGNLIREVHPGGLASTVTYDAKNNATSVTDPLGHTVSLAYDPSFNTLASLTDARGKVSRYAADAHGNFVNFGFADGTSNQFAANAKGLPAASTDRSGQTTHTTYDALGRPSRVDLPDGTSIAYGYDPRGNLTSVTDKTGSTAVGYDAADRPTLVAYPSGLSLSYTYDAAGRLATRTDQGGYTVRYGYDAFSRLATLTDGAGAPIVSYSYDSLGRLSRKELGNGTVTNYAYDFAGRVDSTVNLAPDRSVVSREDRTYDQNGNVASVTTADGTTSYAYDADNQLVTARLPGGRTLTYIYDAAGNRVSATDTGATTATTVNDLNEVTAAGTITYGYDADGRLTTKTDTTGTTTYGYDALGHLTSVVTPAGRTDYEYNGFGLLSAVIKGGRRTALLVDPTGIGSVVGEYDASANPVARYTQGLGLVSQVDGSGKSVYYNFDNLGNTTELTGALGQVVNRYKYLPFGELAARIGSAPNPFAYGGEYGAFTLDGGRVYLRNRTYDPALGRFAEPDPINLAGGQANLYTMANNNPTTLIDPQGLQCDTPSQTSQSPNQFQPLTDFYNNAVDAGSRVVKGALGGLGARGAYLATNSIAQSVFPAVTKTIATNVGVGVKGARIVIGVGRQALSRTITVSAGGLLTDAAAAGAGGVSLAVGGGLVIGGSIGYAIRQIPGVDESAFGLGCWIFQPESQDVLSDYVKNRLAHPGSEQRSPHDPNDIIGPSGFGDDQFVTPALTNYPYKIDFQNKPDASAPARVVTVTDTLDPNLDPTTFEFGDVGFSGIDVHIPEGQKSANVRVDLSATKGYYVDISAAFNVSTGLATWTFTTIDPKTGDVPSNLLVGFLPPDVTAPQGEGYIRYRVSPRSGLHTGDQVNAKATIVFESNATMDTPLFTNRIDSTPPTSRVAPLPATVNTPTFLISWSGTDGPAGSGIASYSIFVSTDGGPFLPFVAATRATSAPFKGAVGHSYAFYSVATDNVDFVEMTPTAAQAVTTVINPTSPVITLSAPGPLVAGQPFNLAGSFNSPSAGPFTATVDYGDRTNLEPLALSAARTFILRHVYVTAGLYRATIAIRDASGTVGTQTLVVTVTPSSPVGNGSGADGFVETLYKEQLGRRPEPLGLKYWTNLLAHRTSPRRVALSIWFSPEHRMGVRLHLVPQIPFGRTFADALRAGMEAAQAHHSHPAGVLSMESPSRPDSLTARPSTHSDRNTLKGWVDPSQGRVIGR